MRFLDFPRPILPKAPEVYRLLGYPSEEAVSAEARDVTREALARAPKLIESWAGLEDVGFEAVSLDGVKIFDGPMFRSEALGRLFSGCPCGVACLITIGWRLESEVKRLQAIGEDLQAVIYDAVGSAATEALQREVGRRLCAQYEPQELHVTRHYSPGYSGWPLEDQPALFALLERSGDPLRVRLSESAMMVPRKALTSIWGISADPLEPERSADAIACAECDMHDCDFRRMPYQAKEAASAGADEGSMDGAAAGAAPGSGAESDALPDSEPPPRLQPVQYAMAAKALGKWARQLLSSSPNGDGSTHFQFRFLGSTCSSGGTPIGSVLHALIRVRPEGVIFEKGWIEVAENDPGLHSMCAFYARRWVFHEGLLVKPEYCGQTLERILNEIIPALPLNPAGCFCKAAHVHHKWRMALSTIHYALTMGEARRATERVG